MKALLKRPGFVFLAAVLAAPLCIAVFLLGARPAPGPEDRYPPVPVKELISVSFDPSRGTIEDLPQRIRELDGKLAMLDGMMYLPENADLRPNEFLLIEPGENLSPSPRKVWQFVRIRLPLDKKAQRLFAPVQVYGQLHIGMTRDAKGKIISIYQMDAAWMVVP